MSFKLDLLGNLKSSKAVGANSKATMLDFLLDSILSKSPSVAKFAIKLEECKNATKLELDVIETQLKNLTQQQGVVNASLDEKQKSLEEDKNKLMPILQMDLTGEIGEAEEQEIERLNFRIDY